MSIPHEPSEGIDPIANAIEFLSSVIRPRAEDIDQDADALGEALKSLASEGYLGLRVPVEYGGTGLSEMQFRRFQEASARSSGCLAFLQTQHQSACAMLAKSENEQLKRRYLPAFAKGEIISGIAFSQLRKKADMPVLSALGVDGGLVLNGSAPWVTGLGFFQTCVTAATTEDGQTIFVLHPLSSEEGHLKLSEPMRLASMEPAQTVSATFTDYFVPEDHVLFFRPGNWIEDNDMINVALQSPFALGCAAAALDIVEENHRRKEIPAILVALKALTVELAESRKEAYAAMDDKEDRSRSLSARGAAVELALRCAAAAVVTSSGAGNSMRHPAQRVYREALVFAVSAQTAAIMEASLERITRTSA
jgi:alkylation response protein AidB-like acyl-CoA dehydrogenase